LAFDKVTLDTTIDDINLRLGVINAAKSELQLLLFALESIQDETYIDRTGGAATTKKRRKKDQGTGADVTNARRDTVYDVTIPKVQLKLAQTI